MKQIAYIIGHRSSDNYRLKNLLTVIAWLNGLVKSCRKDDIKLSIVVIEQDKTPTLRDLEIFNESVHYAFIYNDNYYNRGLAFNVGFRLFSSYDYFYFADNDIILNNSDILHVFRNCFRYDAVNPYSSIYNTLEHVDTQCFKNGSFNIRDLRADKKIDKKRTDTCFSGGIMGISKKFMLLISGWDEAYIGRGFEDFAFTAKIRLFSDKLHTFHTKALHLYHPPEENTTREINEKLNQEYCTYNVDDYIKLIKDSYSSFGSVIKYVCKNLPLAKEHETSASIKSERYSMELAAREYYEQLARLVKHKHPGENFCNKFIYYNLCEQHNCHDHSKNDCSTDQAMCSS